MPGLRIGQPSKSNLTAVAAALARLWAKHADLEAVLPNEAPFHHGLGTGPEVPPPPLAPPPSEHHARPHHLDLYLDGPLHLHLRRPPPPSSPLPPPHLSLP